MSTIEIGCGQITWITRSNETPEEQVLAEIAQAGYAGAPAGPTAPGNARIPQYKGLTSGCRPTFAATAI